MNNIICNCYSILGIEFKAVLEQVQAEIVLFGVILLIIGIVLNYKYKEIYR